MVQIENDVYSQIGLVMLIGLAAKNAILIVEFAKDEHEKGKPLAEAALEGARLRLRPILMTSCAFILGCMPLWTASGAGSVARQVMGTTVIGGMLAKRNRHLFRSGDLLPRRKVPRKHGGAYVCDACVAAARGLK
jgi:HAE1 family hydrophobic/amphiphilic exporter-1